MGEAPESIVDDSGETLTRNLGAEIAFQGRPATAGWPIHCKGSSVHPSQAQELRDLLRKKGVPTEVDRQGRPIYRNASHRKRALSARGLIDRDSFN